VLACCFVELETLCVRPVTIWWCCLYVVMFVWLCSYIFLTSLLSLLLVFCFILPASCFCSINKSNRIFQYVVLIQNLSIFVTFMCMEFLCMLMINSFFFFFFFFPPSRACFIFFLGPYFCSLSKTCSAYLNFSLLCFMFPVHSLYPGISGDHMDLMNSLSSQVLCESV